MYGRHQTPTTQILENQTTKSNSMSHQATTLALQYGFVLQIDMCKYNDLLFGPRTVGQKHTIVKNVNVFTHISTQQQMSYAKRIFIHVHKLFEALKSKFIARHSFRNYCRQISEHESRAIRKMYGGHNNKYYYYFWLSISS